MSMHADVMSVFVFSLHAGHAFFKSCPDSKNGKNCSNTKYLESQLSSSIIFDTRLGFRDGGLCGIKQDVRSLSLQKDGERKRYQVYYCNGSAEISRCSNNSRFNISYQCRDQFDFQLTLSNLSFSDAGLYTLEVELYGAKGSLKYIKITRMFNLTVYKTGMCVFLIFILMVAKSVDIDVNAQ